LQLGRQFSLGGKSHCGGQTARHIARERRPGKNGQRRLGQAFRHHFRHQLAAALFNAFGADDKRLPWREMRPEVIGKSMHHLGRHH